MADDASVGSTDTRETSFTRGSARSNMLTVHHPGMSSFSESYTLQTMREDLN